MTEKTASGAAQGSRILRNYMAKFLRAKGVPAGAAKYVRGARINFSFPDDMTHDALDLMRQGNQAYHLPPGLDNSNIVLRGTKGTRLGPANVLAHELGHATDAAGVRVPGWRESFGKLPQELQDDVRRHDYNQGTAFLEAEPYAEGHRKQFMDWMKEDPARLEKLKLLSKRLKTWERGSHRGEANMQKILAQVDKTAAPKADAYAKVPRGLRDLLSFFRPGVYKGETHNCYQGARKIRDTLESKGIKSDIYWILKKHGLGGHHFMVRTPKGQAMDYGVAKGNPVEKKLQFLRRPDGFKPREGTSVKISKTAVEKIAQFIISKGPATAAEYLESLRKIMAAKEADKAKVLAKALKSPAVKPRGPAKPRKKKQTPLYGMPTGHGTAAFRFGD